MSNRPLKKALEIRISTIPAVSVIVREGDLNALKAGLQETVGMADDYFDHDLAVIDLSELVGDMQGSDLPDMLEVLRGHRLNPVAIRGASGCLDAAARELGLSLDLTARPLPATAQAEQNAPKPPASELPQPVVRKSMIVDTPVRAGQRIYARDADLTVTAAVNAGAEIIADGSIHVYAPLRGRALAGARGDSAARIFALSMEPELVSIAGIYNTFENGFPAASRGRPMQVRLAGDRIEVAPVQSDHRT